MNRLVIGNLLHRPLRSSISILAVAIEVTMILSIVGIMVGMIQGSRTQTNGIGADLIVRPPNQTFLVGVSGAPAPAKIADVLRKLPHVVVASPVIQQISTQTAVETIWGIDYQSFNALRPFVFLSGSPFQDPNDVIVDDFFARSGKGYRVGDSIPILNHTFRICGIVEHGKGGRKFLPIKTLGTLLGAENNATLFYVKTDNPDNEALVRQEIQAVPGLSEYRVQTVQEVLAMLTPEHLPGFNIGLHIVISIAVGVGFLVIFQAMYTAVLSEPGDRNFEVVRGFPDLYRQSCFAGNCVSCACRHYSGHRPGLYNKDNDGRPLTNPTISHQPGLLGECHLDRLLRSAPGRKLSSAQSCCKKDPIEALSYE